MAVREVRGVHWLQDEKAAREVAEARAAALEADLADAKSLAAKQSAAEVEAMAAKRDSLRAEVTFENVACCSIV